MLQFRFLRRVAARVLIAVSLGLIQLVAGAAEPPKLVVALMVDQLRYDYLERFAPQFVTNGFRLLTDHGAFMTFARYNYAGTVTGPGHATFLSGGGPAQHGIIGNDWFDKEARKEVYCASDSTVSGIGTTNSKGKMSPRLMIGGTIADELRLRFNSKVISAAIKDRSAIFPAGKKPAGAFWYDEKIGKMVTSSHYMTNLPAWVEKFNARELPESYRGKTWERLLPEDKYQFSDQGFGEGKLTGTNDNLFPHTINFPTNSFDGLGNNPFGDDLIAEFALAAIDAEALGQGKTTDMLCLSFSSLDGCGHTFGPNSHEIQDHLLRLDGQFARIFSRLEQRVGLENVMIVLSTDHGVAPTPEFAKAMGLDGQRMDPAKFLLELMERLDEQFGSGKYFQSPKFSNSDLYLNHDTLRDKQLSVATVSNFIRDYALSSGWFQAVYTREQLLEGRAPGLVGQLTLNGFNAERSGDIVFIEKPYVITGTSKTGTSHGTPYSFDTRIPVAFYGKQFKQGRFADEFYITDIAATLAAALRITEPALSVGKPLARILAD